MKYLLFIIFSWNFTVAQTFRNYPENIQKLMIAYPGFIKGYDENHIIFNDSIKMIYDDKSEKSHEILLKDADVEDIFFYPYNKGKINTNIKKNIDPGRIRNDIFFKKIYGQTAKDVQNNLIEIDWCPKLTGQKIKITSKNNVHLKLQKISLELDEHPEWKDFLKSTKTFNWRIIRGTNRLSTHSFGIAIDINTTYSNYWQWDCKCINENSELIYKNRIPQQIVDIFEKYGFIWGGRWYHYDTMHFEYRPELIN